MSIKHAFYPWHLPSLQQWHHSIDSNRLTPVTILRQRHGYDDAKLVKQMTQRLLCDTPVDCLPCQDCRHCHWVNEASHVNVISADAAEKVSIDDIRQLEAEVWQTASFNKPKIITLFGIDSISLNAQSALLKTLEEPPENTYFILTAENLGDVLPTVLSRSRRLAHPRDREHTLWRGWVQQKTGLSDDALHTYLEQAHIAPLTLLEYVNEQDKLGSLDHAKNQFKAFLTGRLGANAYTHFLGENELTDALTHTLSLNDTLIKQLFHRDEQPIKTVWQTPTEITHLFALRDIIGNLLMLSRTNCDLALQTQSALTDWNHERRR